MPLRMYESYTEDVLIKNIEILTHINAIVFWERRQIVSQVNATLYANMIRKNVLVLLSGIQWSVDDTLYITICKKISKIFHK